MSVELLIGNDEVTLEQPQDYRRAVNKLTDTSEQMRVERREPTSQELEHIVHAAETLCRLAVGKELLTESHETQYQTVDVDKVQVAMATGALAGVLDDPYRIEDTYIQRIGDAYRQILEGAFPTDGTAISEEAREINEIQQRKFEIARDLTSRETSFTDALDRAGRRPDTDTDVSTLVSEVELQAHATPPTYDELLERIHMAGGQTNRPLVTQLRSKAHVGQLFDGYELFNGGDNPARTSAQVARVQAVLKAQKAAEALATKREKAINGNEDTPTRELERILRQDEAA